MATPPPTRRFAQTIRIKPSHLAEYMRIHNPIPDAIAAQIKRCNISDYSIFVDDGTSTLFATFKYSGADFERDMEAMRNDPATREWWATTDAMQESFNAGSKGSEDSVATKVIQHRINPVAVSLSSMERALMYSHYYICKKPNMSRNKDVKAPLASVQHVVVGAHGVGEEAREDRTQAPKGRERFDEEE